MCGKKGKKFYIVILVFIMTFLSGCNKKEITRQSDIKFHKAQDESMQVFTDLKKQSANTLLQNSIELPYYEGYGFTPTRFTNNGWILGELKNLNDANDKYFAYYDVDNKAYHKVKKLFTSQYSSVSFNSLNDQYIVFYELNATEDNQTVFYLYNIDTQKYKKMMQLNAPTMLLHSYIYKDFVYISLPSEEGTYAIYEYDIKKDDMRILDTDQNENTSFLSPVRMGEQLYYIKNDRENFTSQLMSMNLDTRVKEQIFSLSYQDTKEQFYCLKSDEDDIYVFIQDENFTQSCYKFDVSKKEITPFFREPLLENPSLSAGYMLWSEIAGGRENRVHPVSYMFDYQKQINYEFLECGIMASEKGIVWTKYTRDEKEIPKGELYNNENTKLMYKSF